MVIILREETKRLTRKHSISLRKGKGQSHLVDSGVLQRIIKYANVNDDDTVLEVGPGLGNLTKYLCPKAAEVLAIEKDKRLAEILKERIDFENFELIIGDVLEIDFPEVDKIVSNLPYSISSPLTFKLMKNYFELAVLMYQKEFAERLVAEPGSSDYSRLTVKVSINLETELLELVSRDKFIPQPEVTSGIVRMKPRENKPQIKNQKLFSRIVDASFQHRRQKLRNALYHDFEKVFKNRNEEKKRKFLDKNLPEKLKDKRPGKITPLEFVKISNMFEN